MVHVEGRWFSMGSASGADDERPVHRVWVDAFELAPTQVTNAEYARFVEATGHPPPPFWNDPQQPVVAVSWFDAVAYCDWLGVRLPTEAEWECAARGGAEGARYPWGDVAPDDRTLTGPELVGQRAPNGFGLYDMCENVHEWCSDWYAAYEVFPDRNPRGPETGTRRASRGGSWRHQVKVSRCAARSSLPPEYRYADYGFRVAAWSAGVPAGWPAGVPRLRS
jgi:formylglycine-generating enzyme required for sulfatase activity